MSCLAMSLTLISAFMPVPPAAADQGTAPPAPVVAQTAPEPVAPPPPPPPTTPPPQVAVSATPAPAPGYVVSPPPPAYGGMAPQLKGPSIWGILPYSYYGTTGLGVGARFMIPLGIPPLLKNNPSVRDSFALEFGADYLHWSFNYYLGDDLSVNWFLPNAAIMWNLWLSDKFVVYPKFALGYEIVWVSGYTGPGSYAASGIFWDAVAGAMYKLDNGITLRAELGYAGLKAGVGWLF